MLIRRRLRWLLIRGRLLRLLVRHRLHRLLIRGCLLRLLVRHRLRRLLMRGRLLWLLVRSRLRSNRLLPHRVTLLSLRLFLVTAAPRLDFFVLVRNVALDMLLLAIRSTVPHSLVFSREIDGR